MQNYLEQRRLVPALEQLTVGPAEPDLNVVWHMGSMKEMLTPLYQDIPGPLHAASGDSKRMGSVCIAD